MAMIVTFGLTTLEVMDLRTRGMTDAAKKVSAKTAGQVYKQTHEFEHLRGNTSTKTPTCSSRSTDVYLAGKYTHKLYDRPSALLDLRIRTPKADVLETMLYGCVT